MISPETYTGRISNANDPRMFGYVPVFGQKNQHTAQESQSPSSPVSLTNGSAAAPANPAAPAESGFLSLIKGAIDIVNPLQHIPVVSAVYRRITGDEISPIARIAGDGLFGGPIGAGLGMADVALKEITGKDSGETVMAAIKPSADPYPNENTQIANAKTYSVADIIWTTPDPNASVAVAMNDTAPPENDFHLPHASGPTASAAPAEWKNPEPAAPHTRSYTRTVQSEKGTDTAEVSLTAASRPGLEERPGAAQVDLTPALEQQDAPVRAGFTPVPPELIAQKMMEALDKYQSMQQSTVSADAGRPLSATF